MLPLTRTSIGLSISIALHAFAIMGLIILWKSPALEANNSARELITVRLLPSTQATPVTAPLLPIARSQKQPKTLANATTQTSVITVDLARTADQPVAQNSQPSTFNFSLSRESANKALSNKSLAQQTQDQVGTKHTGEHERLAQNIEKSAKPNCLSDRGMGLFNVISISRDIANDKCKFD
jgi:hypothetical protein